MCTFRNLQQISFAFVAFLASGCASTPIDQNHISIVAEPNQAACNPSNRNISIDLLVRNDSRGKLQLYIDSSPEPGYQLSWLSYRVLREDLPGDKVDLRHGPGGHGPMPPDTISIGPGDSISLVGVIYGLDPEHYNSYFRIQFKDLSGNWYTSQPIRPCLQAKIIGLAPN